MWVVRTIFTRFNYFKLAAKKFHSSGT